MKDSLEPSVPPRMGFSKGVTPTARKAASARRMMSMRGSMTSRML